MNKARVLFLILLFYLFVGCFYSRKTEHRLTINDRGIFFDDMDIKCLVPRDISNIENDIVKEYHNKIKDSVYYHESKFFRLGLSLQSQIFIEEKSSVVDSICGAKTLVFYFIKKEGFENFHGCIELFGNEFCDFQNLTVEKLRETIPESVEIETNKVFGSCSFYNFQSYVTFYFDGQFSELRGLIINIFPQESSFLK